MRPKSLVLLALALGCGLVAAVGINQILATPSDKVQTVSIVVAKQEIQKGNVVKPEDIRLQEWNADSVPEGAITQIEDLAERRVKNLIYPNEPILAAKLVPKGVSENDIPAGMRAVTVQVDAVTGLSGLVSPGDNVDILVHTKPDAMHKTAMTKVLLRNVKVHAIDTNTHRPDAGEQSAVAKTVTLLANPKQANEITHASQIGTIQLLARSTKDNGTEDEGLGETVTTSMLFGGGSSEPSPSGGGLSTISAAPDTGVGNALSSGVNSLTALLDTLRDHRNSGLPEKPVEQPFKMVVIEGTEAKEMEFTKDSPLPHLAIAKPAGGSSGDSPTNTDATEKGPSIDDILSKLPPLDHEVPNDGS